MHRLVRFWGGVLDTTLCDEESGLRGRPEFIISHQIEHIIVYCYIIME
jgi:hypothetical protein